MSALWQLVPRHQLAQRIDLIVMPAVRMAAVDAHMDPHMSHEEMLRHLEADT